MDESLLVSHDQDNLEEHHLDCGYNLNKWKKWKKYGPMSLLNSFSKIFVYKYYDNHFRDNFLLSPPQDGFLPYHSNVSHLLDMLHNIYIENSQKKQELSFLILARLLIKFAIKVSYINWS